MDSLPSKGKAQMFTPGVDQRDYQTGLCVLAIGFECDGSNIELIFRAMSSMPVAQCTSGQRLISLAS